MKINDADTSQSLYHFTKNLVGLSETDAVSLTIQQFIRSANAYLYRAGLIAWRTDGGWKFDDSNYNDLPIATATLVNGQQTYTLPTTAFDIERVEVKDSNGDFVKINPIKKERISDAMSEFRETNGMPEYYYLLNGMLFLYPAPDATKVTVTNGLKLYIARNVSEFTTSDTTKEPGFNTSCHSLISYGSALDYAIAKNMGQQRIQMLQIGVSRYEKMLEDIHARRGKELKANIRPKTRSSL